MGPRPQLSQESRFLKHRLSHKPISPKIPSIKLEVKPNNEGRLVIVEIIFRFPSQT